MGGVYVSPYSALIDGMPALVVCDDFYAHTNIGPPAWTANVTQGIGGSLSNTRWQDAGLYDQAAWLVTQIMSAYSAGDTARQGHASFALWGLS
jgi:hypothetical protein